MRFDKDSRRDLFGTPVLSRQMQMFIASNGTVGLDEIKRVFPDVSPKRISTTLYSLKKKGAIVRDSGCWRNTGKVPVYGSASDGAWKAARILRTFKAEDIARIGDVSLDHAMHLCKEWFGHGDLVVIGKDGQRLIYRLVSDSVARPIVGNQNVRRKE